jgi:hypothetical protein
MATGSGKTLLMHAHILQYRRFLEAHGRARELNRIILLTPNEGLSQQHLREFEKAGIEAEVFNKDNIAVNVVSPSGLVLTPGVVHHKLHERTPESRHEPVSYMAEAAHALATGDPATVTGMVTYAKPCMEELGVPFPE